MTDDPKQRRAKAPKDLPWVALPLKEARERVLHATLLAKQSYAVALLVFVEMQDSAQRLDDGGNFKVSRPALARDAGVELHAIDAVFTAFGEAGLIIDEKCATFVPMISRDQRLRAAKKAAPTASKAPNAPRSRNDAPLLTGIDDRAARDAEASDFDPPATRIDPSASRLRTESSESSSTTIDLLEDPPSSSSGEAARATTTTEGIFSKIVEAVDGRVGESVIRRDLPVVRKWIEAGYDLDGDILPELAEIAEKSTHPLRTLKARFIAEQLADRRARRLAAAAASNAARPAAAQAAGAVPRPPPRSYAPNVDFNDLAEREIMGNG